MAIIEWLNEPNGDRIPKSGRFTIEDGMGINIIETITKVFPYINSNTFTINTHSALPNLNLAIERNF